MKAEKNESILILVFGHDKNLLETRQWVLQSRGYRTVALSTLTALSAVERTEPVRLILLCQSLAPGERDAAIAISRSRWPESRHLALTTAPGRSPTGILGQLLHTMEGPAKLISMVGDLVDSDRMPQARAS